MNEATKSAGLGVAFCAVIWMCTGLWQFAAIAAVGMAFTWVTTPPTRPQPRRRVRDFVRVEIRDIERLAACYDYGGCKWRGDGVKGQPLILGPGKGCHHLRMQASLGITEGMSTGKRVPDHRAGCTEEGCEGECWPPD
jgi:hypothetical protein